MPSTNLEKIYTSPYKSFNFQQLFFYDIFFGSDESPKGYTKEPKGQRMLKEPQNNVFSYSKWKILTKTHIFN